MVKFEGIECICTFHYGTWTLLVFAYSDVTPCLDKYLPEENTERIHVSLSLEYCIEMQYLDLTGAETMEYYLKNLHIL